MPHRGTPGQQSQIATLLDKIARTQGEETASELRAVAKMLPPLETALLLDLVHHRVPGVDVDAVGALCGLGYSDSRQVMEVSRLVEAPGHAGTVRAIVTSGLRQARADDLLDITPKGTALLGSADDRSWRRAITSLPKDHLGDLIEQSATRTALWFAVVSASDPAMGRRIKAFADAGVPYIPWIVSGHAPADLKLAVQTHSQHARLTRLAINKAVRVLDGVAVDSDEEVD